MVATILLGIPLSLALLTVAVPGFLDDKTRYDQPEIQNPYGPNPHGPDPHGRDPHDEVHDKDLPANNPDKYFGSGSEKK